MSGDVKVKAANAEMVIAAKVRKVTEAKGELEGARAAESAARSEECRCVNAYNAACKELDAAMAELRKDAPRTTNWCDQAQRQPRSGAPA